VFDNNRKELRWDIFDEIGVVKLNITLTEDNFSFKDVKSDMIIDGIFDGLQ
jgi:hypothetical protein